MWVSFLSNQILHDEAFIVSSVINIQLSTRQQDGSEGIDFHFQLLFHVIGIKGMPPSLVSYFL